ncbi:MAG: hypothetical protein Q6353_003625 [Candidatus Sigynarchaeum springense]
MTPRDGSAIHLPTNPPSLIARIVVALLLCSRRVDDALARLRGQVGRHRHRPGAGTLHGFDRRPPWHHHARRRWGGYT